MKRAYLSLIFILIIASNLLASNKYSGNTEAQFLLISPSAKAVGLGNSYVSLGTTSDALYYNPSLITHMKRYSLSMMYSRQIASLNFINAFGGMRFNKGGSIALGFSTLIHEKIFVTKNDFDKPFATGEEISNNESCIYLSYAVMLGNYLSIGATAKEIVQKISTKVYLRTAADAGIVIRPRDNKWGIGLSILNFGIPFKKDSFMLPFNIMCGGHYNFKFRKINEFLITTALQKPIDDIIIWNVGMEYSLKRRFSVRVGYQLKGSFPGLRIGGGFGYKVFVVDYSFAYLRAMVYTHTVQLTFNFKGKKRKEFSN